MEDEMVMLATADPFAGLPAIFRDAADPECVRYALDRPWIEGDWVAISDGCIAVRVPAKVAPASTLEALRIGRDERGLKPPKVGPLFDGRPACRDEPIGLPRSIRGWLRCKDCGGKGKDAEAGGQLFDCLACDGKGKVCNSKPIPVAGPRGDYSLMSYYAAMLARHGATAHLPLVLSAKHPVCFTAPGDVEGLLMPMTTRKD